MRLRSLHSLFCTTCLLVFFSHVVDVRSWSQNLKVQREDDWIGGFSIRNGHTLVARVSFGYFVGNSTNNVRLRNAPFPDVENGLQFQVDLDSNPEGSALAEVKVEGEPVEGHSWNRPVSLLVAVYCPLCRSVHGACGAPDLQHSKFGQEDEDEDDKVDGDEKKGPPAVLNHETGIDLLGHHGERLRIYVSASEGRLFDAQSSELLVDIVKRTLGPRARPGPLPAHRWSSRFVPSAAPQVVADTAIEEMLDQAAGDTLRTRARFLPHLTPLFDRERKQLRPGPFNTFLLQKWVSAQFSVSLSVAHATKTHAVEPCPFVMPKWGQEEVAEEEVQGDEEGDEDVGDVGEEEEL